MPNRIIILIFSSILICGCANRINDERLTYIAGIVSYRPNDALSMLDSIKYDGLSDHDRHFFDFLSIKANDKAYVRHESDSLILDVIDYYSSHNKDNIYPEALYYGGRVFSDLGDLPTALRYFHEALNLLPENAVDYDLRCRILSQTGRLLNKLRLYKEAAPYIESSIDISRNTNDTIGEVYDLQLLGTIYQRAHDFTKADSCFHCALWKSRNMPTAHRAKSSMYISEVKYRIGQIDSALIYVRHTPDSVNAIARNSALSIAADIYYTAGILDTAYMYAYELVNSPDPTNKRTGYWILLTPELRVKIHPDSVNNYLSEYLLIQESYYNDNENQLAIMQQSYHNYQIHEQKRHKAELSNITLRQWLLGISSIVFLLVILVLFLKIRNANARLALHSALEKIELLRQYIDKKEISRSESNKKQIDTYGIAADQIEIRESTASLRDQLRRSLYDLYSMGGNDCKVASEILDSDIYLTLVRMISNSETLADDSSFWKDIEDMVLGSSPDFLRNLRLLVGGKLSSYDIHTALLIKCGIQPAQMSKLLNRTKGTISSRRESLCMRVFDKKMGTKVIDGIIRLL